MKKVLLLGGTGKMGKALNSVFSKEYNVISVGSKDLDVRNENEVRKIIKNNKPDIVINTVAFLGIDPCEQDPIKAFEMNMVHPMGLAKLSNEFNFLLVHFSTDAVFSDNEDGDSYDEYSAPNPVNVYGMTKLGGDMMVQEISEKFYIIRISVLFGHNDKNNQFVEKMLSRVNDGVSEINIADDIIGTPCYSKDVALVVKNIIKTDLEYGLYHAVNDGKGSLYDLMSEISRSMKTLSVVVNRASHKEFQAIGRKNTNTPLKSRKLKPIRHWKDAVKEYCKSF
jgi:dTDP-4-dehydrorhamnose reductase